MDATLLAGFEALGWYPLAGAMALVGLWEALAPAWQSAGNPRPLARLTTNLGLLAASTATGRLLVMASSLPAAGVAAEHGWGLAALDGVAAWGAIAAGLLAMDLARYALHAAEHRWAPLWRLHRLHHTDTAFDLTTAVRHHPFEALVASAVYGAVALALGVPPLAVALVQVLWVVVDVFNHGAIRIPPRAERMLRCLLVTPDMHRVHHSADRREHDANFGSLFSFWDRWLGTYCPAPRLGHEGMTVGLRGFREPHHQRLDWALANPFLRQAPDAAPAGVAE